MPRPRCLVMSAPPGSEDGGKTGGPMRRRLRRWGRCRARRFLNRSRGGAIVTGPLLRGGGARRRRLAWRRGDCGPAAAAILARRHPLELLAERPFGFLGGDLH